MTARAVPRRAHHDWSCFDGWSTLPQGVRRGNRTVAGRRPECRAGVPGPHLHESSDEAYVVLEGSIDVRAEDDTVHVGPDEALVVGAGVVHALVAVDHPARGMTIPGPAIVDRQTGRTRRCARRAIPQSERPRAPWDP